ncbi:hypothetical protein V6N13_096851 [Hibiscus sabdariffa]
MRQSERRYGISDYKGKKGEISPVDSTIFYQERGSLVWRGEEASNSRRGSHKVVNHLKKLCLASETWRTMPKWEST